jgi:serine/threonine protein kinase
LIYREFFGFEESFVLLWDLQMEEIFKKKFPQKLNETEIFDILVQLLECLKQLCSKSIFHQNLTQTNILFVKRKLKISEFGMVNPISSQGIMKTRKQFMAPEMFIRKERKLKSNI